MCRPLWAAWVGCESIFSRAGEGSHHTLHQMLDGECSLADWAISPDKPSSISATDVANSILRSEVVCNRAHPFEAVWTQKREAQWQPNTNRFYGFDDVPTRKHFALAQERFEKDMGTPDLLRDWVMAGAKLYGIDEIESAGEATRFGRSTWNGIQPLISAALQTLQQGKHKLLCSHGEGVGEPKVVLEDAKFLVSQKNVDGLFNRWADMFSSPKNRVDLWKN